MRRIVLLFAVPFVLAACGAAAATPAASPTFTPSTLNRPPSSVQVKLISPTNGLVVHGTSVHVVVAVSGGTVTPVYSTHISPTVGHVHLYMNSQLVYMSYTLTQDLPVVPGAEYSIYAEWVASDHFPFDPRDLTSKIYFSVAPS